MVNVPGNEDLFSIGYVNLAGDNASVGEIEDARASRNYKYARTLGGIRADTEKQYKGWAMMQIFSPENVGMMLGLNFVGGQRLVAANNSFLAWEEAINRFGQ